MKFRDLREFLDTLEANGDLVRVKEEIDPNLEMTEIADRTLRGGGPALLFENPKGYDTPLLANLFGTEKRVALGMGADSIEALREIGELLAYLRQPDPPKGMRDLIDKATQDKIKSETSSGSLVMNDAVVHLSVETLPFGGVGASGMGSYHGRYTCTTFSQEKTVLVRDFSKEKIEEHIIA